MVTAKILCVDFHTVVRETRCAVLQHSGYDTSSASPEGAETVLRSQKFDLLIVSSTSDSDLQQIVKLSAGADVMVLQEFTVPTELLSLVAHRLNRQQRQNDRI
jgi:hypothetical protein